MVDDELHRLELNLHPNEASGLLTVEDEPLLEAHGWEIAFWAVLDEGEIEDCVAVIGHRRGADLSEGWEIERLRAEPMGDARKTEDAEAITRHDGWIYILGSHFGGKGGPLQPKRGFVARFREAGDEHASEDPGWERRRAPVPLLARRMSRHCVLSRAAGHAPFLCIFCAQFGPAHTGSCRGGWTVDPPR